MGVLLPMWCLVKMGHLKIKVRLIHQAFRQDLILMVELLPHLSQTVIASAMITFGLMETDVSMENAELLTIVGLCFAIYLKKQKGFVMMSNLLDPNQDICINSFYNQEKEKYAQDKDG